MVGNIRGRGAVWDLGLGNSFSILRYEGRKHEDSRLQKRAVQRPCGPGNPDTLREKERKILWLDQTEQQQWVGDASGEVSRSRETYAL